VTNGSVEESWHLESNGVLKIGSLDMLRSILYIHKPLGKLILDPLTLFKVTKILVAFLSYSQLCKWFVYMFRLQLVNLKVVSARTSYGSFEHTLFPRSIVYLGIICLLLSGCSRLEQSEREKIRRRNCTGECIYRNRDEIFYPIVNPVHTPRSAYPWEAEWNLPRITRDFFRCKGSGGNPPIVERGDAEPLRDCEGRHGLPILYGKEGVYPILIDLLNYLQKKTGKRVVVTCGHRCPLHNTYADFSKENRTSKHQIGAEVDFYVQGMEDRPLEVIGYLMQYYHETSCYRNEKEYIEFKRYDRPDSRVAIQPWMNKEIFIKVYQKNEGRDGDNRHPHAYLSLQVRFDKQLNEKVLYCWEKAHQGYPKSR
jgi:hypothetical protein